MIKLLYMYKIWIATRELKLSDLLVCGSQWSRQKLVEFGVPEQRIRVIPYPIDLQYFKMDLIETESRSAGKITLLWLGRIVPRKRLDLLLDALSLILAERKDIYLRIFGGFSYSRGLRKLVSRFRYQDFLFVHEPIARSDVIRELHAADVLIQSSENENFGSAVAEALCCGLPVIVGPTNGTKDYVSETSFIFDNYSVESLRKTILMAAEAVQADRLKIALDCRKKAEECFGISDILTSLENIFAELVQPDPD